MGRLFSCSPSPSVLHLPPLHFPAVPFHQSLQFSLPELLKVTGHKAPNPTGGTDASANPPFCPPSSPRLRVRCKPTERPPLSHARSQRWNHVGVTVSQILYSLQQSQLRNKNLELFTEALERREKITSPRFSAMWGLPHLMLILHHWIDHGAITSIWPTESAWRWFCLWNTYHEGLQSKYCLQKLPDLIIFSVYVINLIHRLIFSVCNQFCLLFASIFI